MVIFHSYVKVYQRVNHFHRSVGTAPDWSSPLLRSLGWPTPSQSAWNCWNCWCSLTPGLAGVRWVFPGDGSNFGRWGLSIIGLRIRLISFGSIMVYPSQPRRGLRVNKNRCCSQSWTKWLGNDSPYSPHQHLFVVSPKLSYHAPKVT